MVVQYQVRPITRYVVTRYEKQPPNEHGLCASGCSTRGEYDNANVAFEVAYALCKSEHDASGDEVGSMNFIYPERLGDRAD